MLAYQLAPGLRGTSVRTPQPLPRAFLSHASSDKAHVDLVFKDLGPTLAEIDQVTFEPAIFNFDAILRAFERCSLFVLFASQRSIASPWVAREISEALKRLKDLRLKRIVVFCADKQCFQQLEPGLKEYNIVRIEKEPLICSRQIRGILAEIKTDGAKSPAALVRDENLMELKELVIDPARNYRTLAVSGFARLGRRSLIRKFIGEVYGSFEADPPSITVDRATSLDDVYRRLLAIQYGSLSRTDLVDLLTSFTSKSQLQQQALVSDEIRKLYDQHVMTQFVDEDGILGEDGDFSELMSGILSGNSDITDLMHVLVLSRNAPERVKRQHRDAAFYVLPYLTDRQAEMAIRNELKARRSTLDASAVTTMVGLSDGHPANIEYLFSYLFDQGSLNKLRLDEVLSGRGSFAVWRRNRATAYVKNLQLNEAEKKVVSILTRYRAISPELLAEIAGTAPGALHKYAEAVSRLVMLNIVDARNGQYRLVLPLRDALEKDSRFDLTREQSDEIAAKIAAALGAYGAEDSVPIDLLDPAIIAGIRNKSQAKGWASSLVRPSHFIWLARESYQARSYREALELCREALKISGLMTSDARLEALRFAGLAAARLDMPIEVENAIAELRTIRSRRARGNLHFLAGFNARLRGQLQLAQSELEKALAQNSGSIDAQREIIGVLLARGVHSEALQKARGLYLRADNNKFVVDAYVQARIAASANVEALEHDTEFSHALDKLEEIGDGPGLAFFSLRKCDIALRARNRNDALFYSKRAIEYVPSLPSAHAARVKALMLNGQSEEAFTQIKAIIPLTNPI